jgi:putative ABC transport system permease protein
LGTDSNVQDLFLMESVVIGILGGGGGILIGLGLGKAINFGLNVLASHMGGKPFELFILPFWFAGAVLSLSILIGLIAGYWPAKRAARLSPHEAFLRK